jgi:hypothetical protein
MGVTKDTKIYYQHNTTEPAWNHSNGVEATLNGGACVVYSNKGGSTLGTAGDRDQLFFKFRNKANDADVEVEGSPIKVFGAIASDHAIDATSAWAEGVLPFVVHASVADAKTAIMNADMIAAFDSDTDRNEYELVDGGKGLKHTFDWPVENDASADSKYKQFKDTYDSRWVPGTKRNPTEEELTAAPFRVNGAYDLATRRAQPYVVDPSGKIDHGTYLNSGCIQINSTAHIF